MTKEDILRLRDTAEQTKVQFKERVTRDNKFVVKIERKDVNDRDNDRDNDSVNDRDGDREDREKRDKEDKDNLLNTRDIEKQGSVKRDKDRDEEAKDKNRVVRIPYKQLSRR